MTDGQVVAAIVIIVLDILAAVCLIKILAEKLADTLYESRKHDWWK